MLCCLNPACGNPSVPDNTNFCFNCGVPLVILRHRYRPIKLLGAGGFGKTYLAEDIDKLNEKCVIKQFVPQVEGTAALNKATELFEQEARRLQELGEHSQIPTLLAYFKVDNRLYLVQQFIDGQNLSQGLLQQGTFSEKKIQNLLEDLLNILKVVHQYKVIHRDIKPDNIIQRGDGKVVLIDFGTSKQLKKTVMTGQGTMIGSFGYAPLEQMKGGEAYPRSDLFSLGATCFHLLSGIDPSELWITQGYGWVNSWEQHLQQSLSQGLRKIIGKLLQVDCKQRYQSVEEVLQDLNLPSQSIQTKNAEDYYNEGIEKYDKEDYRLAIEDFNQAIKINPDYAEAYRKRGNCRSQLGDYQGGIEDYNQAIEINPYYAEAYVSRSYDKFHLGDEQAAIEDCNQAIKINPNYAKAYNNRGAFHRYLGNYQAAIEDHNQAIKINPDYALAYGNRGLAHRDLGNHQAAIEDFRKAADLYKRQGQETKYKDILEIIEEIEEEYYYNKSVEEDDEDDEDDDDEDYDDEDDEDDEDDDDYYNETEDYTPAVKTNYNYAEDYYNQALNYYNLKNYQAAIEYFIQVIKFNSNYANAYLFRGNAYFQLGNYQAAIFDYNQAIIINPYYADAYLFRGNAYFQLRNYQAAILDYNQVIIIQPHNVYAHSARGLALSYLR